MVQDPYFFSFYYTEEFRIKIEMAVLIARASTEALNWNHTEVSFSLILHILVSVFSRVFREWNREGGGEEETNEPLISISSCIC